MRFIRSNPEVVISYQIRVGIVPDHCSGYFSCMMTNRPRFGVVQSGQPVRMSRMDRRMIKGVLKDIKHIRTVLLVCTLVLVLQPFHGLAQQNSDAAKANFQHTSTKRDGQHDFDFEIGTWKTHLKRLVHPLTRSTTWIDYEGDTVVRKVWNGRANLVELEADGPGGHFEGLNLRLYNPESHQWSLNFIEQDFKSGCSAIPKLPQTED
jgi:hypothetical protein